MGRRDFLAQFLEIRKLRNTAGRRAILREISDLGRGHFSAEDLVARFRGRGESVSRATVYRTLEQLVSCHLLARLSLGGRHSLYESREGKRNHEHLLCVRCGGVAEFSSPALERLLAGICRRRGFTPQRRSVQLVGLCRSCAKKPGGRAAP